MEYDFKKFLKYYVYISDLENYNDHDDRILMEKIEEVLMNLFGEKIVEMIALPSTVEGSNRHNVYAVYDNINHPFGVSFITDIVKKTIIAFYQQMEKK